MIELPDLSADVTLGGTPRPRLIADVSVSSGGLGTDPIDDRILYADVSLAEDLVGAAFPGGGVQHVGFRVTVEGEELTSQKRSRGVEVTRSLGEGSTWSLSMPLGSTTPAFAPPLGTIRGHKGPPPGLDSVTIDGLYKATSGVILSVRLLTNGIVHGARQRHTGSERFLELTGVGPVGRYDHSKVSIELPPGMGLDRGTEVLRRLAAKAGVSNLRLSSGGRMDKEFVLQDEQWLPTARELMKPSGRVLQFSSGGSLTNPRATRTSGRYDHVFKLSDLLVSGVGYSAQSTGPTSIKITGNRQVVREGDCGIVTEIEVVETWGNYAPKVVAYIQDSDGSLNPPVSAPFTSLLYRLTGLLYTERQTQCGDVISERRIEAGWTNPTAARYRLDTDGTTATYVDGVFIYDSGATKDDNSPAYKWPRERFMTLRDERKSYTYDDDGFLVGVSTRVGGWLHKRAPVKSQAESGTSLPWEEVSYISGQRVLANGEGVDELYGARIGPISELSKRKDSGEWSPGRGTLYVTSGASVSNTAISRSSTSFLITEDGFIEQETKSNTDWIIRSGSGDYYYEQEGESPDALQTYQPSGSEVTTYIAHGEGGHDEIERKSGPDGQPLEGENRLGLEGYLPAATKRTGGKPDSSLYEPEEDPDKAKFSSREESQRIEASCSAPGLEAYRPAWEEALTSEWSETVQELRTEACTELRLRTAIKASFQVPANFLIREGQRIRVEIPDYPVDVHVKRVRHSEGGIGALSTTTIEGDVYVV